ncbi:ATP-binding protein [Micromonospora chersina]|uniref:ATP-binding protein n=1 Tax=Micromonospora chersina TaxID=47854 RepID=UPI003711A586
MDLGTPSLRLCLLGGFRAERSGHLPPLDRWRRPSARTLVKLLAVSPGHRLHREQAMEVCWPEAEPAAAVRNLRVALHTARHALEPELPPRTPSSYLRTEGDLLALHPTLVTVDLDSALDVAATALATEPAPLALLEEAHARLIVELLPEDRYATWLAGTREALAVRRHRVALALAAASCAAGLPQRAVDILLPILEQDPAAEDAHAALIRAYLALGQRRHAIGQYHRCRELLVAELGTPPSAETERLYRQALTDPATTRATTPAPGLPAQARRPARLTLAGREHAISLLGPDRPPAAPVALISGEAGVGKTRLVTEAARRHAAAGSLVLWGAGHEAEGHTPYGVWVEALDGYLADRPARERAAVGSQYPELATLLPSLGLVPPPDGDPERQRGRIFGAVAALLTDLSARPLLVVLDDLHAADAGSAQLLYHLARSVGDRPWWFLATWRDEDLPTDDGRRLALEAVQRHGLAQRVELMRLSRADCDRLVGEAVGRPVTEAELSRVYALSLGNPLFAIELAGPLRQGGLPPADAEEGIGGSGVPGAVRQLVDARMGRLSAPTRRMVEVLAVAGGDAPLVEVLDVTGNGLWPPMPRPAAVAALAAAIEAGIVEEREVLVEGRRVLGHGFRHPLIRLACGKRLSEVLRRQVHTAYADAVLRHRPDAVDVLAYHLTRAEDPRAVPFLWRAARRAASLYANDSAAGYYARLIERLDADGDPAAADARLACGEVLRRLGRYPEAERVLTEALADWRARAAGEWTPLAGRTSAALASGAPDARAADVPGGGGRGRGGGGGGGGGGGPAAGGADVVPSGVAVDRVVACGAALAQVLVGAGRPVDAVALLAAAPVTDPAVAAATRAAHHLAEALTRFATGRYADSLSAAEAAARLARDLDAPGAAAGHPPSPASTPAQPAGGSNPTRALPADAPGRAVDADTATRADGRRVLIRALVNRSVCLAMLHRTAAADIAARTALPLAEAAGDPDLAGTVAAQLSELACLDGRLTEARQFARRALDLAVRTGDPALLAFRRGNLGRLHLLVGDWAPGIRLLRSAAALARPLGTPWCLPYALVNLGIQRLWTDDVDGAEACLAECRDLATVTGDRQALSDARIGLAEIAVRRGAPAAALALLRNVTTAGAAAVRAWAHLAAGEADQAARLAGAARDSVDRIAGIEAGRVHGLASAALGRTDEALDVLSDSIGQAEAMPYPYGLIRLLEARAAVTAGGAVARRDLARATGLRRELARAAEEAGNAAVTAAA